ncbi:MAG: hypothetical protein ACK55Z_16855, partial [bacterium]
MACRYLGVWGTPTGDMSATKTRIFKKTEEARDLLKRQRRRRLLQIVTGTFPCGQQLVKYGYKEKAECILCKKAH